MTSIGDLLLSLSDDALDKLFKNGRMAANAVAINERANEHVKRAYEDYSRIRERTIEGIDNLNKRKIKILGNEIVAFVELYEKIGNINNSDCEGMTDIKSISFSELDCKEMNNEVTAIYDFIVDGTKAYAIGGIILGNVLMNRKAKTSLNNAKSNLIASEVEIDKLEVEKEELKAIYRLAKQQDKTIRELAKIARKGISELSTTLLKTTDYNEFTYNEKQMFASLRSLMKLIKLLINQPIIDINGNICTEASKLMNNEDIVRLTGTAS